MQTSTWQKTLHDRFMDSQYDSVVYSVYTHFTCLIISFRIFALYLNTVFLLLTFFLFSTPLSFLFASCSSLNYDIRVFLKILRTTIVSSCIILLKVFSKCYFFFLYEIVQQCRNAINAANVILWRKLWIITL